MASHHRHRSVEAEVYRRWYWTSRWRKRAKAQLAKQPLCERCLTADIVTPATVANHKTPHRGDEKLFWEGELESSCKPHHDGIIQAEEARGYTIGSDASGRPIDASHPWNRPS